MKAFNWNLCLIAYGKLSKILTSWTEKFYTYSYNQEWISREVDEAVVSGPPFESFALSSCIVLLKSLLITLDQGLPSLTWSPRAPQTWSVGQPKVKNFLPFLKILKRPQTKFHAHTMREYQAIYHPPACTDVYGLLWGLWVWRRRTNRRSYCPPLSNPSTSSWTARPNVPGRWDDRMAAQHLPRDLVLPSSGLKQLAQTMKRNATPIIQQFFHFAPCFDRVSYSSRLRTYIVGLPFVLFLEDISSFLTL